MTAQPESLLTHLVVLLAESEARRLAKTVEPKSRFYTPDDAPSESATDVIADINGQNSTYSQFLLRPVDNGDTAISTN